MSASEAASRRGAPEAAPTTRSRRSRGAAEAPGGALGDHAARGVAYAFIQNVLGKAVSFLGQLALARLLAPEHFGLIGLAYTVNSFAWLIQQAGLREVLVQRPGDVRKWVSPAVWMSGAQGLLAAGFIVAAAPIAARVYHSWTVAELLFILALAAPFQSLATSCEALLQRRMGFRAWSTVEFFRGAAQIVLSVLFAWLGFGAYSFALPVPIVAAARLGVLMWLTRPSIRRRPQLRRWRYLFGTAMYVMGSAALLTMITQGANMVQGVFHDEQTVGLFYFSFILAAQAIMLFSTGSATVLFPVLSSMQDSPERMRRGFLSALRLLLLVGTPVCLIQAACAGPFVRLVLPDRWLSAIPVTAVLSLAMIPNLAFNHSRGMMQAQGRFGFALLVMAAYTVFYLTAITVGALVGGALSVATAFAIVFAIIGPLDIYLAGRSVGVGWRDVARAYLPPLLCGLTATASGWLLARLAPAGPLGDAVQLAIIGVIGGGLYVVLIRVAASDDWASLIDRLRRIAPRLGTERASTEHAAR